MYIIILYIYIYRYLINTINTIYPIYDYPVYDYPVYDI